MSNTLIKEGASFEHIQKVRTAHSLSPEDHLEIQKVYQDYIDNSISKTIYLPSDFVDDTLPDLLLDCIDDIKGVTLYKDNSRDLQPLVPVEFTKEMYDQIKNGIELATELSSMDACKDGTCDI